jgi:hypothetical protein
MTTEIETLRAEVRRLQRSERCPRAWYGFWDAARNTFVFGDAAEKRAAEIRAWAVIAASEAPRSTP